MELTRLFDILELYRTQYAGKPDAFAKNVDGKWITYSAEDYIDLCTSVSYGLLELGLEKGDRVATISQNRPEWNMMDMGIAQAGLVHVPIYPTISSAEQEYILNHCEAKVLCISDQMLLKKVKPVLSKVPSLKAVYTYNEIPDEKYWLELVDLGKSVAEKQKPNLKAIMGATRPEDLLTIIYTSGTTGNPKGVMLSHHNLLSNTLTSQPRLPIKHPERAISFLPLCHVYERMVNYIYQLNGIGIYYVENLAKIGDFIREIKPQIFNTVPRLLERVYDNFIKKGKDLTGVKKLIYFWAVKVAHQYKNPGKNKWWYERKQALADKLIFKHWRAGLGGNIKIIVSGGSALQERLIRIFWAAGLPVYEGYGLTESSPVIAVNDPRDYSRVRYGTVGPILENLEVKIAEDGEILCKGPSVMMGYYKDAEQTRETIRDGWLHTGDIGVLEDGLFLRITDRKKEIFKNSAGKYIAPQVIENILKESELIEQAMVVGENEKFASAIISPNFDYLHFWATKHKVHFDDNLDLCRNKEVISRLQKEINQANKRLGQVEQIKRFRLVCDSWTPETGELSPTLKLKRKELFAKYEHILKEIYSVGDKNI
ncbi:MAG TPA: long-chain fatty acid--CoA ligase [Bacteroidales bacterium]|nr:long-chain fatty acid--CoA ligase [Bacteroidales bacterium]